MWCEGNSRPCITLDSDTRCWGNPQATTLILMGNFVSSILAKRYFTIGEVAELCGVKPHVLRY